jgi:hypothetical protein
LSPFRKRWDWHITLDEDQSLTPVGLNLHWERCTRESGGSKLPQECEYCL